MGINYIFLKTGSKLKYVKTNHANTNPQKRGRIWENRATGIPRRLAKRLRVPDAVVWSRQPRSVPRTVARQAPQRQSFFWDPALLEEAGAHDTAGRAAAIQC
jgi:hypothetical protein